MRTGTVSYRLEDLKNGVIIPIGFVGENDFTRVIFDAEEIYKKFPNASVSMKVQPPKGGIYPATVTRDGNTVIWQVKEADVANRGGGELQLTFTDGETKIKTYIAKTDVKRSLAGNGPAPDPVQDWIDDAEEVLEEVEAAEINQPTIGEDGYWYTWNQETGEYVKSDTKAQGADGAPGQDGAPGRDGIDATPTLVCPAYADLTFPVTKDTLCYKDGTLYKAKQDISTSEAWTAAHWDATNIDTELHLQKNDIHGTQDAIAMDEYPIVGSVEEMIDATKKYVLRSNLHIYESEGQPGDPPDEFDIWEINKRVGASSPYTINANGYFCTEFIPIDPVADAQATIRIKNASFLNGRYGSNKTWGSCKYEWFDSSKAYISNNYMTGYNGSGSYWKFTVDGNDLTASLANIPSGIPADARYVVFCWVLETRTSDEIADGSLSAITEEQINAKNFGIYISTHSSTVQVFVDTGVSYSVGKVLDDHEDRITTLEKRAGSDIIGQNSDVIDAVNASCRYGIHSGGTQNTSKQFCLLVTTDPHRCWDRMDDAVKYLNTTNAIDAGCCLGDIVGSDFTENTDRYNAAVAASEKPFLTVIGNHDCGNSSNPAICGTTAQVVAKFITPNEGAMGKSGLTVPYYTWIDTNHKITFICLYNYDSPEVIEGGSYTYPRGYECYSQTQVDWLIDVLEDVPSDHAVVIMEHAYKEPNAAEVCSWTQLGKEHISNNINTGYGSVQIISEIINAWKNGTSFEGSFAPTDAALPTINIDCDFTSRGTGEFICYVVGHQHNDIIAHNAKYNDQKVVCFGATADDNWQNYSSDLPRVHGEKSENNITVIGFDRIGKRVNLVRVGSNKTIHMTDRTMISIPYEQ